MRPFNPDTAVSYVLYRFFDSDRRLLYVGITTGDPWQRWRLHQRDAPWWASAAYVSVELFDDREPARAAELEAIRSEDPIHNVADRPGWYPARDTDLHGERRAQDATVLGDVSRIPMTQARMRFSEVLKRVEESGKPIALTRHEKTRVGVVSAEDLALLRRFDLRTPNRREPWFQLGRGLYLPARVSG